MCSLIRVMQRPARDVHTKQQMVRSAPRTMSKEKARSAEPGIDQSSLPGGDKL